MLKRELDFFISLIVIIFISPVFFMICLLIAAFDSGPVFFKQDRVGLNGRVFKLYKFRTMRVGADKEGPFYTSKNDERITFIGKYLRKTSTDELPQLLNVILGDMSLVGPRPDVPLQQKLYESCDWNKRISVRPGITGLAQALKRSSASAQERTRLDLEYVDTASFLLDLKIIFLTVKQVIFKGGN